MENSDQVAAATADIKLLFHDDHLSILIKSLIIFLPHFKEGLRMVADRTDFRSGNAHNNVSAVAAFPDGDARLFKHRFALYVFQKRAVSFLMRFFNGGNAPELRGESGEPFFLRLACHSFVHVCPLGVFALGGVKQVFSGISQSAQSLEPQLCVFLLVLRGLEENGGDLLITRFFGYACKIGLLVPRV